MPIPDYQTLMLPVLSLAAEHECRVPEVADRLADDFGLTAEERARTLPSGKQFLFRNRVHWAKFYLTKADLLEMPRRGVFIASAAGRALLARKPTQINVETLKKYPAFMAFYNNKAEGPTQQDTSPATVLPAATTPEEQIDAAHAQIHAALQADLLARILEQPPAFFERVIVKLLTAMGYGGTRETAARQLGKSNDGGVDGVIDEDRLGLDRIYVQAKRYTPDTNIGRPAIQGFVGSLVGFGATKGVFVTTSCFSKQAHEYVEKLPQRVILIDGASLAALLVEHDVGVRVHNTIEVKRIDEDFFTEDG